MPTYTQDYMAANIRAWINFFKRVGWRTDEPKTVIEVGSYEGSSAVWILNNLLRAEGGKLYCIDAWAQPDEGETRFRRFQANIAETGRADAVETLRAWSHEALVQLLSRGVQADFIYIDGAHDALNVLRNAVMSFEMLKPGGVMILDDYLWNNPKYGGNHTLGRPKIAIDAFTTIYADALEVATMPTNVQTFIRKRKAA